MADLDSILMGSLERHAADCVAAAAVVERAGAAPVTAWLGGRDEPAFLAYSVTKTFIAALALQLRDEGALSLDDPVVRWLPDVPENTRITLRQLLGHTAGVPDYGGLPAYHRAVRTSPSQPWTFHRYLAETLGRGLLFPPGQAWAYSNPGYMLAKRIVEEAGGSSLATLVRQRIAGPLGLERTFVAESIEDLAGLAPALSSQLSPDRSPCEVRGLYHPGWVSHGVVASTASDIARFLDALLEGDVVAPASRAELTALRPLRRGIAPGEDESPLRPREPGYGLGLMGDSASPWGRLAGHNGGGPGYAASAFHAFDLDGASVCAMGAAEAFNAEAVVAEVLDALTARRA